MIPLELYRRNDGAGGVALTDSLIFKTSKSVVLRLRGLRIL